MEQFRLRKARIVGSKIAISQEEPISIDWSALRVRLAPSGSPQALLTLRSARRGSFIGLMINPQTGTPTTFRIDPGTTGRNVGWLTKQDRTVSDRIQEMWLVELADWGLTLKEPEPKEDDP